MYALYTPRTGTHSPFAAKELKDEGAICLCAKRSEWRKRERRRLWCTTRTHAYIYYDGIPNVRDVARDRSKGLEHARRAKKRRARGPEYIVGVDGSETRETQGLYRLFLSRQGRVLKFRHAGRALYVENERKRSPLVATRATNQAERKRGRERGGGINRRGRQMPP